MPLLMGDWRFFVGVGGPEIPLTLSDLQASGHFKVSAPVSLYAQLFPQSPPQNRSPLGGEGWWNEIGQSVSFGLINTSGVTAPVMLAFTGHQVPPPGGGDPAQDQVWTLVGEFRHVLAVSGAIPAATPLPHESARRFIFGWYAQITQVI
jgi:hypothetical protein